MNKKEKLLILSDLYGTKNSQWITSYLDGLNPHFEIEFLDSQVLGKVSSKNNSEEEIHKEFISFGIENAVQNLVQNQKYSTHILGFSVGGTIAWKASLAGLQTKSLTVVSATRIRYETEKPKGLLKVIFGEKDRNKPLEEWFEKMKINPILLPNESHECYQEEAQAKLICSMVLDFLEI